MAPTRWHLRLDSVFVVNMIDPYRGPAEVIKIEPLAAGDEMRTYEPKLGPDRARTRTRRRREPSTAGKAIFAVSACVRFKSKKAFLPLSVSTELSIRFSPRPTYSLSDISRRKRQAFSAQLWENITI